MFYQCRHIRANGTQCRASVLKGADFCYFHGSSRRETFLTRPVDVTDDGPPLIEVPTIDDLSSIRLGVTRVLTAIARQTIDPKRASLMLYGLQIGQSAILADKISIDSAVTVTTTATDLDGNAIAALPDPEEPPVPDIVRGLRFLYRIGAIDKEQLNHYLSLQKSPAAPPPDQLAANAHPAPPPATNDATPETARS